MTCSECGQSIECPNELREQSIKCPSCGTNILAWPDVTPSTPKIGSVNHNLKNCSDCRLPISKNTSKCPHCGAKNVKHVGPLGLSVAALFVIFMIISIASAPTSSSSANPAAGAYEMGESFCRDNLKAPSTAIFSGEKVMGALVPDQKTFAQEIKPGWWHVQGYVDSQNGFGAMIRNDWVAVIREDGTKWGLVYLRVGDSKIGEYPK